MEPPAKPVVLIADNDAGVTELLRLVFAREPVSVESVADGRAALDRIGSGGVALLICDLDMPALDGHAVLERLARAADGPPVLVISGFVDPRREAALRAHSAVRGVFEKPFDLQALLAAARRVLAAAPLLGQEDSVEP